MDIKKLNKTNIYLDLLLKLDLFGVSYKPYIEKDSKKFKSPFGGFLTLIIYIVSFMYFIYLSNAWLSDQIQPKIQETSLLQKPSSDFFYINSPISVDLVVRNKSVFAGKKLFDIKFTYFTLEGEYLAYNQSDNVICSSYHGDYIQSLGGGCLDLTKINKKIFQESSYNAIMLYVLKCNTSEDNCATDEEISSALLMRGSIWFRITSLVEQYDFLSNKILAVPQVDYIPFEQDRTQFFSQFANVAEVNIDDGILLYVKEQRISHSSFDIKHSQNMIFQRSCYLQIQIGLNSQYTKVKIQNVKISEILAQISSIFDLMMLLKFLAKYYNDKNFNFKLHKTIVTSMEGKETVAGSFLESLMLNFNILKQKRSLWQNELNFVLKKQNIYYQFLKQHELELILKQLNSSNSIKEEKNSSQSIGRQKDIKIHPSSFNSLSYSLQNNNENDQLERDMS